MPRDRVKDSSIARLFHSYISNISTWYDLSDAAQSFGIAIPRLSLDEPLLFHAIVALSAMHACKTSTEGSLAIAQRHHTECVRLLISLDAEDELVKAGIALVATCLLRSYEILGGMSRAPFGSCIYTNSAFQVTLIATSIFAAPIPWLRCLALL